MKKADVIIIGAGAAGLMCAIEAGRRGRRVVVLEKANKPGKKILMSGGGRCNFTNYHISPEKYISHNPHFCKSALSRYTQWDFIELVKQHEIPFHEKTLGQLFCDEKSKAILNMLLAECEAVQVDIQLEVTTEKVSCVGEHQFRLETSAGVYQCESLVVASGGLSIPTLGSSPFGYQLAEQLGIKVWPTRAGLVPLTLHEHDKAQFATLAGVSFDSVVSSDEASFRENSLFTHRGLSGPAVLQISSYWRPGEALSINLLPDTDVLGVLEQAKQEQPQKQVKTILAEYLPKRMVEVVLDEAYGQATLQSLNQQQLQSLADYLTAWHIKPNGTEGYRTAEVTLGGVDCDAISSKTLEAKQIPGLYFIGEVLDVTGWLGGYNFQWAWSSGWAAGQVA